MFVFVSDNAVQKKIILNNVKNDFFEVNLVI